MISALFTEIGNVITSFAGVIGNGFSSIIALFWDSTLNTGAGGLTTLGILSLVPMGLGLVWFAYKVIRNLFHARG